MAGEIITSTAPGVDPPKPSGSPPPAADLEVDLPGGEKIKLPKEAAERVIKARDALKAEARAHAEQLGAMQAEKAAAEAARRQAEERAQIESLQKKGEYDKAREIQESSFRSRLDKVQSRVLDGEINSAIARLDGLVKDQAAKDDLRALLRTSCRFDVEADKLEVIDAAGKPLLGQDGKPVSLEAHLRSFIDARPYLKAASGVPGSGAAGAGKVPVPQQMKRSDFSQLPGRAQGAFLQAGGTLID